ncbi:hypothetical protein TcYC6_0001250 [Trypanosoma cruzi]|nr:hypothetical protein TcYC6_0001250 [Trypanosoma cruzi]
MAGAYSVSTAQPQSHGRRKAGQQPKASGLSGENAFPSLDALAFPHLPLGRCPGSEEEERRFLAFDRRCFGPRVWNEGVSGSFAALRSACAYVGARWTLWLDLPLTAWFCGPRALGMDRDPTGGFIASGGALMQDFRSQIMMATEPSVLLSALRVCPRTQKQRLLQCRLCRIYGHDVSACKLRGAGGRQEAAKADDGGRTHSAIPRQGSQASHRTADAPSDPSDCPTQSSKRAMELMRQRRLTVARRIAGIPALGRLCEDSERGGSRNVGAAKVGAGTAPDETICNVFCLTHEQPMGEKSRAAFCGSIGCGAVGPTASTPGCRGPCRK